MAAKKAGDEVRLTGAQYSQVMEMIRNIDSIELKLTVPVAEHRATIHGLPLDQVEAEPREVFFFDTPELALSRAGVVVRARRIRGGSGDTVVKLRPVVPANLPKAIRHSGSFKVEVDVVPEGFVCSASLKGKSTSDEVRAVGTGTMKLSKLLTREQRAFYRAHAPRGITLDSLSVLGPTFALKSVFWPKELQRKTVMELWLYPDGTRLLELSTKSAPAEGSTVGAEFRNYLAERGITVSGEQPTKTKLALEFHSRELRAKARQQTKRRAAAPKR